MDLTAKNRVKWAELERRAQIKYYDNASQFEILKSLTHVSNNMTASIGPPGAGKIEVLSDMVNGIVMCGHKTIVCAVSNNAVDKAANSWWAKFPKEERKAYKFLRYETESVELQALLRRTDGEDPTEDEDIRPTYKGASRLKDYDVYNRAMAQVVNDFAEDQRQLRVLLKAHQDMTKALEEKWLLDSKRESNVPAAMTLPNSIFQLVQQDREDAVADYKAVKNGYLGPRMSPEQIERIRAEGKYRIDEALMRPWWHLPRNPSTRRTSTPVSHLGRSRVSTRVTKEPSTRGCSSCIET